MADRQILLPQPVVNGHGFGRNILHDPRSIPFRIGRTATPKDVEWDIYIPVLNQANIGKCVAETGAELLGSEVFWKSLPREVQLAISTSVSTAENWTLDLYRELTRNDPFPGSYEPDDTGSNGLTLGKILVKRKLVSGYQHAMSVGEAEAAIQQGPFAIGTMWLSRMETPRPDGTVLVSGTPLGGHEYLCFKRDAARDLWWFRNHWTAAWGLRGTFAYDTPALARLLAMQGDITTFVPITAPKPVPLPVAPEPAPQPVTPGTPSQPDWGKLEPFLVRPKSYKAQDVAVAELKRWRATLS
jgi:hypothetical protein